MNIAQCILHLRPNASFTVWNNDINQVVDWRGPLPIPTFEECQSVWPEVERKLAVPKSLSRAQFKIGLIRCNIDAREIKNAIDSIPDTKARAEAHVRFEDSELIHRDHPLITQIAAVLGKTEQEIDAVFIAGAS